MNGVTAAEFSSDSIAVTAWQNTVAKACDPDKWQLITVDILSVSDIGRRLSSDLVGRGSVYSNAIHTLSIAQITFDVHYTLQEFNSADANATTVAFKTNYRKSVEILNFTRSYANEIRFLANNSVISSALIQKIVPGEVFLAKSYIVVQTTALPTYRPSAQPSSGILHFCELA